jgi:hypothetical protein
MSFGKRGSGDPRPAAPIGEHAAPERGDAPLSVRTRVANHGGLDKGFISLAAGVVVLSAGAAIAAPSVLSMFGPSVRPIAEIVAGLDRDEIKVALAAEAFPDEHGRAFMTLLADNFPDSHNRLLGTLADAAAMDADRDDLVLATNMWGLEFIPGNLEYVGRTGAEGFDSLLTVATDTLDVLKSELGGCTLDKFTDLAADPARFEAFIDYGSASYKTSMRANAKFIELAARGRNAPKPDARLNADDENALQSVFISFITDPQLMNAMQGAMFQSGGNAEDMQKAVASKIDICQLGRSLVIKLERLPSGTKSRILAAITSGDMLSMPGPLRSLNAMNQRGELGGMGEMFGAPAGLPPEVTRRLREMQ